MGVIERNLECDVRPGCLVVGIELESVGGIEGEAHVLSITPHLSMVEHNDGVSLELDREKLTYLERVSELVPEPSCVVPWVSLELLPQSFSCRFVF
jgi:hypothetical protein